MIEKPPAQKEIARIAGLKGFPHGQSAAIAELVIALQCADSEAIAKQTVDDLLAEAMECPAPATIRRAVNVKNEAADPEYSNPAWPAVGPLCQFCASWGWIKRDGKIERCMCENGRALAQNILDLANSYLQRQQRRDAERARLKSAAELDLLAATTGRK
jgi:hypothetical protein